LIRKKKGGGKLSSLRNYQYFGKTDNLNKGREFPEVDATLFNKSAITFRQLIKDASSVLDRLADSKHFAEQVMSAAQISDTSKVEELIESTGIKSKVEPTFNPDGITMVFHEKVEESDCCKLTLTIRW
jgi:hypothetical protein